MTSEIENYSATSSFNDAPIKISSEDLLNRDNFANFIVQEILSLFLPLCVVSMMYSLPLSGTL